MTFAKCGLCSTEWKTMDDFLSDPFISFFGMEVDSRQPDQYFYYYFYHRTLACNSSIAISSEEFKRLILKEPEANAIVDEEECPRLCFSYQDIKECERPCRNAAYRELARELADWPKQYRLADLAAGNGKALRRKQQAK